MYKKYENIVQIDGDEICVKRRLSFLCVMCVSLMEAKLDRPVWCRGHTYATAEGQLSLWRDVR